MQFIPSTWEMYGVDANNDGRKDPYNPVDAICAAARYLKAAGGAAGPADRDLRLQPRRLVRRRGPALRQPVRQAARRPDRLADRPHRGRPLPGRRRRPLRRRHLRARGRSSASKPGQASAGNAADVISTSPTRRGINIYSARGRAGRRRQRRRRSRRSASPRSSASYIVLQDAYGNRFTYAELGERRRGLPGAEGAQADRRRLRAGHRRRRRGADSRQRQRAARRRADDSRRAQHRAGRRRRRPSAPRSTPRTSASASTPSPSARRTSASADVDRPARRAARRHARPATRASRAYARRHPQVRPRARWSCGRSRRARRSSPAPCSAASARPTSLAPHVNFSIQPAGPRRADDRPEADPRRLEAARGDRDLPRRRQGPVRGHDAQRPARSCCISKEQLGARVLADPRVEIYECGRQDIQTGQIDRRILAAAQYLVDARLPA